MPSAIKMNIVLGNYKRTMRKLNRMKIALKEVDRLLCQLDKRLENSILTVKPKGKHPIDSLKWSSPKIAHVDPGKDAREVFNALKAKYGVKK